MGRLAAAGIDAWRTGFSTSRTAPRKTSAGAELRI